MIKLYELINRTGLEDANVKIVYHAAYSKNITLYKGPLSGAENAIVFDTENKLAIAAEDEYAKYEDLKVMSINIKYGEVNIEVF